MEKQYNRKRNIAGLLVLLMLLPITVLCEGDSWEQISEELSRAENWQRIVENSPFRVGEATPWAEDESVKVLSYGTYPSLDGSTVCVPLAMELARQHLSLREEDLNGFVSFSTTPYAYERLIYGQANPMSSVLSQNAVMDPEHPIDLILVTEPSEEELRMAEEEGIGLKYVPFCYDAFVFVNNINNPVSGLTTEQIRSIYIGRTLDWGDVGGLWGSTILAYQRPENSGSQTLMENRVMAGLRPVAARENFISDGMSDLVEQVGSYANSGQALGYTFLYYITELYRNDSIRVLTIDGVEPTEENLRSGKYPYTVSYWAVYREGDENTERFVEWLVSDEGQRCVRQAGYIPVI